MHTFLIDHLAKVQTLMDRWSAGLCNSPWAIGFHLNGLVPGLILGTLWFLSAWTRFREVRRLQRVGRVPQESAFHQLPSVTVVLPVRGYRMHSASNWKSILEQKYNGRLEYIFVMESRKDSACAVISDVAHHSTRTVRTVFSGPATSCSQKIYNLVAGITQATKTRSKYVVCLDDDVQLHPLALSSLITDMEQSPECRVGTGYPFDIPDPKSNILTYAALAYHLPLLIGLSLHKKTQFVWGGCMVFRAEDVSKDDKLGFLAAWMDGGYSDDLIVAARSTQLQLPILCPSHAMYPQWLDGDYNLKRYWNYLRRQLFVLDTYSSSHNRRTNHSLALLHCYGSWSFVIPCLLVFARIGLWSISRLISVATSSQLKPSSLVSLSSFNILSVPSNSVEDCNPAYRASIALFVMCSLYMFISLFFMMRVVLVLLLALNPALSKSRLHRCFDWPRLVVGFWLANAILPICMAYTFATSTIEWSSIVYRRCRGKVVEVIHTETV